MKTVEVDSQKSPFAELLKEVKAGGEVVLTENSLPFARIVPETVDSVAGPAKAGLWQGLPGSWISPDFDEPLDEFKPYME